ncbi:MAG: glycosyltransferase [Saprospiraceae bacterium]|nr:glycosyltransferase [Saprospiraceae bacterium]
MIAYNVEAFIEKSIDGVLNQQTGFPIELVIGEDCSKDGTRHICEAYAQRYPGIVRLLDSDVNHGMAGNYARTLEHCRGKYIAVCDSDDIWVDPLKLQKQVDFLENNPDYGVVYTDVQTISETGALFEDPDHEQIRENYATGNVFFRLLQGNFINHPTTLYRRAFLDDYTFDRDRNYYNHDHLLWLHIAPLAKIHFMDAKTTHYRKHSGSATRSAVSNRKKFQWHLYQIILNFDQKNRAPLDTRERLSIFQKMLSILYRRENNFSMKTRMLRLMPKYFPGMMPVLRLVMTKMGIPLVQSLNENILNSNLTESNL